MPDDTAVSCAKMAERIEMPFALWTRVGPRKHVYRWGADWRNLANTIKPFMCSGDAAFLSNYFDHLLLLLQFTLAVVAGLGIMCL